jgi:hypothetical protein
MKANQKLRVQQKTIRNFFLLFQIRFARLNPAKWSEALTQELEENIDAIGMTVLIQMLELIAILRRPRPYYV